VTPPLRIRPTFAAFEAAYANNHVERRR